MIAKLIVHGPTRDVALKQLERALRFTDVGGTVTNVSFLALLAAQPDFVAGDVDTGLIERHIDALAAQPVACTKARSVAALTAMGLMEMVNGAPKPILVLWSPMTHVIDLTHNDEEITVRVTVHDTADFTVDLGEAQHHVTHKGGAWWVDATKVLARTARHGDELTVFWGNGYRFHVVDPLVREDAEGAGGNVVVAPMPGLVKAVFAKAGQSVSKGDRLAILEAMKMEHSLLAPRDGVVAEVLTAEAAQVEDGAALIRLEDEEDA